MFPEKIPREQRPSPGFPQPPLLQRTFQQGFAEKSVILLTCIFHCSNHCCCFFFQSPSPQTTFILQPSSLTNQPLKPREPPRYEDAIKQSRNLHINISQVRSTCRQCNNSLLQSGEMISPQFNSLSTFSSLGSHGNQSADGWLIRHSNREWR